jgi:hypothetical protein
MAEQKLGQTIFPLPFLLLDPGSEIQDPGARMEKIWIWDEKFRIRTTPGSATLEKISFTGAGYKGALPPEPVPPGVVNWN